MSAGFVGMGGGIYVYWFSYIEPFFVFAIIIGVNMILMALLGGSRSLFGPALGALIIIPGKEYLIGEYGGTQLHVVLTGLLLAVVVMLLPQGIIPSLRDLFSRLKSQSVGRTRLPRQHRLRGRWRGSPVNALRTEGLTRRFGGVVAVDRASVEIEAGKISGLIGPNGSGKTTFFNLITGMIPADEGRVVFDEIDVTSMKTYQIALHGLARTFQITRLFSGMTVLQNMVVPVRRSGKRDLLRKAIDGSETEIALQSLEAGRAYQAER